MCLNMSGEGNTQAWRSIMDPADEPRQDRCPVCGTPLPDDRRMRRCPRCGARILWRQADVEPQVEFGVVLFNGRLCGIMAGIQLGMIGLLVTGYRIPLPWAVALIVLSLPVAGYIAAGAAVRAAPPSWRTGLLVFVLALNAGLLAALIMAVLGLFDPLVLAGITVAVAAGVSRFIRRAVTGGRARRR